MAYIRPLANGNFRADVRMKGIVKNKTFPSETLAQTWAEKIEHSIKTIPLMDQAQLLALSASHIEIMGGDELFNQLGVDLFALRNAAKLEAINALSKKELLQLSPQDIERMGGADYFSRPESAFVTKPSVKSVLNIYLVGIKKTTKAKCSGLIIGAMYLAATHLKRDKVSTLVEQSRSPCRICFDSAQQTIRRLSRFTWKAYFAQQTDLASKQIIVMSL